MRFGSLFTGIGGLDLGLERAGMECAWQVEIDDYATRVLERHWPDVPRWRDIYDFIADAEQPGARKLPAEGRKPSGIGETCQRMDQRRQPRRVDLVCGGFPCQPVSVAGNRRGDDDDRWLWPAFRRVVELLKPTHVLIENVPGLISAHAGRLFRGILGDLSQSGYDAEWQTLPAAAFGAPHLRERVFIVAYSNEKLHRQKWASEWTGQADKHFVTHSPSSRFQEQWRSVEPTVRRGNHGIPHRVDRLRGLGNAVVPQVAEWIGQRILAFDQATC